VHSTLRDATAPYTKRWQTLKFILKIMKNLSFILLLLTSTVSHAQNFEWAGAFEPTTASSGANNGDMAIDNSGNLYVIGRFYGTNDFDPGVGLQNMTSSGTNDDGYLTKLDLNGNLIWTKQIGGTNDVEGRSITIDSNGDLILLGKFRFTADFDPGPGVLNMTANNTDLFVSKLDDDGNFIWAKQIGGTGTTVSPQQIKCDLSGNIHMIGYYNGTADFDPGVGSVTLTPTGSSSNIFISKLDPNGDFLWAKSMGGSSGAIGWNLVLDAAGNVYSTGNFQGTADFDPGPGLFALTSNGNSDAFVSKLDINGDFVWATSIGGTWIDNGFGITLDQSGNVLYTGAFNLTVDFDPGAGTLNQTSLGTTGNSDVYVSKLDGNGNFLWVRTFGGTNGNTGINIESTPAGDIYFSGQYRGTVDFDPGLGTYNLTFVGGTQPDVFISKLDNNGNFDWAVSVGGAMNESIWSTLIDPLGNVYGSGSFQGPADFDPSPAAYNLGSGVNASTFVLKLSSPCSVNSSSISEVACDTYTVPSGDETYTSAGIYMDTIPNIGGCDSVITINLTLNNSNTGSDNIIACDSYTWPANSTTYTSSTTDVTVLTNMAGCDSTVTLNLTINNSNTGTDNIIACDSYTWPANSTTYTSSTTDVAVLTNMDGCDSTVTLNLTINNSNTGTDNIIACDSYTWPANSTTYTSNTTDVAVLTNMAGCDSTVTLNLIINNSNTGTDNIIACDSYTWPANSTTYTSSTTDVAVLTNMDGCDSTVTLNLTINNSNTGTDNIIACDSYTWPANSTTYTSSTTDLTVLTNIDGCDSTVTLNLTINSGFSNTETISACESYTWNVNSTTYTSSITVTETFTTTNGCDSILILDLTINNVDNGITYNVIGGPPYTHELSSDQNGATYQWLSCPTMTPISGATNQSFAVTTNGDYAVEVTNGSCVDTSVCASVTTVGNVENNFGNELLIYPNPTDGNFSIDIGESYNALTITITDLNGKLIQSKTYNKNQLLDLRLDEPAGIYLLMIESKEKKAVIRIVKE
jgi:hypothetical protein